MQVFLPYSDFDKTAACLDNKRLGNQCYRECLTLYKGGWPNHPAAKMWAGHDNLMGHYGFALACEMGRRGNWKPEVIERWKKFWFEVMKSHPRKPEPDWMGQAEFHASHRAALLFKDYNYYSQFGWSESPAVPDEKGKLPYIWP